MTVRTNLLLPKELVEELDRFAGPRGRSRYVAEAVADSLRRDRVVAVVRETAGAWRDHTLFPTSDSVIEWLRDRRSEHTNPGEDG